MNPKMDDQLKHACLSARETQRDVVIVLQEESMSVGPDTLGLAGAETISEGCLKASLTGEQILELSERSEIESILDDSPQDMINPVD